MMVRISDYAADQLEAIRSRLAGNGLRAVLPPKSMAVGIAIELLLTAMKNSDNFPFAGEIIRGYSAT